MRRSQPGGRRGKRPRDRNRCEAGDGGGASLISDFSMLPVEEEGGGGTGLLGGGPWSEGIKCKY